MTVSITVRLNAILQDLSPRHGQSTFRLDLPDGCCAEDAVRALGLPVDEVGLVAINRTCAGLADPLGNGDEVILFPRLPYGG